MLALRSWLLATRPRTLAAGLAPVAVGTALASTGVPVDWLIAGACLLGALFIQIGVNFANDAFDALKGADTPDRLGPTRAVASGAISARAMLIATAVVLTLALGVGLYLADRGGWPILVLGLVSLVCAVAYTGGPFPLAYHGLGDFFVFLFFGLFAVLGSAWLQVAVIVNAGYAAGVTIGFQHAVSDATGARILQRVWSSSESWLLRLPWEWWLVAAAIGLQATAIIAVNNLRDIETDARVGKRTLAVRLGDRASRRYYALLQIAAATALWCAALGEGGWPLALPAGVATIGAMLLAFTVARAQGRALNRELARTAALELVTALALVAALAR
ncbi:MAG: 1,4-dihydroxy-2-naphthoate octaprenyltransferase [Planctomycetes bacterium]|nr:1,4-dihydroxy-2-naphthoate octaprenyltransferase [Planctomycetota bacterium]